MSEKSCVMCSVACDSWFGAITVSLMGPLPGIVAAVVCVPSLAWLYVLQQRGTFEEAPV